jgi:GDPmannose 4,6-dehydratase
MKKKIALIIGITGQDGSYLAEFLLNKKYIVHGIKRRSSSINTSRVDHLYIDPHSKTNFFLHYGDVTDSNNIMHIINKLKPNEIYNLSAQSHVLTSFEMPDYTSEVNALGTLKILESIKALGLSSKTKFYQASTSELFGNSKKKNNLKLRLFVPKVLMQPLNYMLIGLLKIIEIHTECMQLMEFCLITNLQEEAKLLLQEKLQLDYLELSWV